MAESLKEKTVSIILATYNGATFIREQIDSLLAQTYPLKEIIIQDDGSTDDTVSICEDYAQRCPIVHFSVNEHQLGFNQNFKSMAMKATGDFVAFCDQDDIWFPEKIEKQMEAIGNQDMCFSTCLCGTDMENTHLVSSHYSLESLLFGGLAGHTMLLRREFVQTEEYWLPNIIYEWSLSICAQMHGGIVKVEEPLNWHRITLTSASIEEMKEAGISPDEHPTYQPYLYGIRNYRRLQKLPNWRMLYGYIYKNTREKRFALAHQMTGLMLHRSLMALFCLCRLCLKHGDQIFNGKNRKGILDKIRAFFYPLTFSYNNIQYGRKS